MGNQDIWSMFTHFNKKYFCGELDKVKVSWSPHMTLCAGKTAYRVRGHSCKSCSIRLSQPLLSQRPHTDTVNTLLHEMIHAYLHVTQGLNYRDSHGPEFRKHMKRINDCEGSKITKTLIWKKNLSEQQSVRILDLIPLLCMAADILHRVSYDELIWNFAVRKSRKELQYFNFKIHLISILQPLH